MHQRSFFDPDVQWGRAPAGTAQTIPPHASARRSDPATSHRAAASLSAHELCLSQSEVLAAFREHGPMTDETLVRVVEKQMSQSRARSARNELTKATPYRPALIRQVGEATTQRGKPCIVWGLADVETKL